MNVFFMFFFLFFRYVDLSRRRVSHEEQVEMEEKFAKSKMVKNEKFRKHIFNFYIFSI